MTLRTRNVLRLTAFLLCFLAFIAPVRSQLYHTPPQGRFSIGALLGTSLCTVSSDVVGVPDAKGDSHMLTTTMFSWTPGIELAYDVDHGSTSSTSIRARVVQWLHTSASDLVHVHDDTIIGTPNDVVITSQHSVMHTISRTDVQLLVAHEFLEIPIRFHAGLGYGVRMQDLVSETITEAKRDTVPRKQVVKGETPQVVSKNSVTFDHAVTTRLGLILGLGLPMRFGNVEFVPSIEYNYGLSTTVPVDANEAPISYSSNAFSISFALLYRL